MNSSVSNLTSLQMDRAHTTAALSMPTPRTREPVIGWSLRILFAIWLALYLFAALGCVEASPMWKKLDGAPYPVQVNTLVTGNRGILSQQRTLTYGDWRVGFAKDAPMATSESNCSWQLHCDVKIEPLTCASNGQVSDCSLLFDTLAERCDLLIAERHEKIRIACPVDIILAAQDQSAVMRLSTEVQIARGR
jgi:hypothetical protein